MARAATRPLRRTRSTGVRVGSLQSVARALIMHDPADRLVPFSHAEALANAWRGAILHAAQGLGHRRLLYDPPTIARIAEHIAPRAS